jgi:hypothetical protein
MLKSLISFALNYYLNIEFFQIYLKLKFDDFSKFTLNLKTFLKTFLFYILLRFEVNLFNL